MSIYPGIGIQTIHYAKTPVAFIKILLSSQCINWKRFWNLSTAGILHVRDTQNEYIHKYKTYTNNLRYPYHRFSPILMLCLWLSFDIKNHNLARYSLWKASFSIRSVSSTVFVSYLTLIRLEHCPNYRKFATINCIFSKDHVRCSKGLEKV